MARSKREQTIFRLSITLLYVEPKVVRKLDVPSDIRLDDLHLYIQAAMGWENDHLWGFELRRYGKRFSWSPDEFFGEVPETISDVLAALSGKRDVTYIYDYGDSWTHRIRIGPPQAAHPDRTYPYLVSGTGKCPLEDIGGAWGYADFLDAFDDPDSKYREYLPGYFEDGVVYDPEDAELDARIEAVEALKR